jgi:hypothetical protein
MRAVSAMYDYSMGEIPYIKETYQISASAAYSFLSSKAGFIKEEEVVGSAWTIKSESVAHPQRFLPYRGHL